MMIYFIKYIINRKLVESWFQICQKLIGNWSEIDRKLIRKLSENCRTFIRNVSEIYRKLIEIVSEIGRKSIKIGLIHAFRASSHQKRIPHHLIYVVALNLVQIGYETVEIAHETCYYAVRAGVHDVTNNVQRPLWRCSKTSIFSIWSCVCNDRIPWVLYFIAIPSGYMFFSGVSNIIQLFLLGGFVTAGRNAGASDRIKFRSAWSS